MTVNVPFDDDMIQFFVSPWWVKNDNPAGSVRQGDLVYVFAPHVDQVPATLRMAGRETPTDHSTGLYEIKPLDVSQRLKPTALPVAAMPLYQDEVIVYTEPKGGQPSSYLQAGPR